MDQILRVLDRAGQSFWRLTLLALALKMIILIADPNPQLFLGDSGSYLNTAITGWIPPDRSYLYGHVIRWICVSSGSLFSLVLVQTLASSLSAGLLGWILRRFLEMPAFLASVCTLAYSLDPLQLMYDRYVMAETFSLLAAMIFISLLLLFIFEGQKSFLILASCAGIVSIAFRISFLPPVFALSFAAPIIRFFWVDRDQKQPLKRRLKTLLISLIVIAISYFTLHGGYKVLTGRLVGAPPAYQYADGFSLLSSWSPLMTPEDLQAASVSVHIFDQTLPMTLESRRAHRWMEGGLVFALTHGYGGPMEANTVAKKVAFHILRRDPIGVAGLALRTYLRGWRRSIIKRAIKEDTGNRVIPLALVVEARKKFHIDVGDMHVRTTLTKFYFGHAVTWYRILLLSPLLLVSTAFFSRPRVRPLLVCVALFAVVAMATAIGLAVDNSIRYLHPLSWTCVVFAGYWFDQFRRKLGSHGSGRSLRPVTLLVIALILPAATSPASAATDASPKGLYVKDGVLMRKGSPYLGIGVNYTTLFGKLLQDKHDTSSLDNLARLGGAGVPFVRFRASGFGVENQQLYLQDRSEFFRRMDLVVRCAEKNNIGLIPSLFWRLATVSELVGESRDQLGNPASKANQFIRQFTGEVVRRYTNSPAIWGWEFGNEANLGVDLPHPPGERRPKGQQLTTGGLRTAYTVFAQTVRKIDRSRIIEPGTTLPRPYAWHLQRGLRGQPDTSAQSCSMLLQLTPDPMNVISVHVYEKAKTTFPGAGSISAVLGILTQASVAAGKPLFVGEFPVRDRSQAQEFLQAIKANRVPLSAFWVFDYPPQSHTMSVDFENERSFVLGLLVEANRLLQRN